MESIVGSIGEGVLSRLCVLGQSDSSKVVYKEWGIEYCLVNNERYCCKIIKVDPFKQGSIHKHLLKVESFVLLYGDARVEVWHRGFKVASSDIECMPITVLPNTFHRMSNRGKEPAYFLEASTHHSDRDVIRFKPEHKETEDKEINELL